MKPPNCKVCKSPHWTYEEHKPTAALEDVRELGASVLRNPAINEKERLTDAINNTPPRELHGDALRQPEAWPLVLPRNAESRQRVGEHGAFPHRHDGRRDSRHGERTPNRRARKNYNAYMKTYMRAYRERSK
jgi:hypothetical protein